MKTNGNSPLMFRHGHIIPFRVYIKRREFIIESALQENRYWLNVIDCNPYQDWFSSLNQEKG